MRVLILARTLCVCAVTMKATLMFHDLIKHHKHSVSNLITNNIYNLRTAFTKFRLSSHKLLVERGRWKSLKLDYELRKCTLCDSGDIEDEYHVTLICEQFVDIRKKYIKRYYHRRPSMAKFVELMNTNSDQGRFKFMIFVNILLKQYENIMEQS